MLAVENKLAAGAPSLKLAFPYKRRCRSPTGPTDTAKRDIQAPALDCRVLHVDGIPFASESGAMHDTEFQKQLLRDIRNLQRLIIRYARGERTVRQARDRLEGAIQVKFALWRAIQHHTRRDG